ncbi:MAG: bifunctional 23S rRNA (guanine(2069)-N(7))-methyltransferase RlmK/23S rRNA (guanine(2445)-N(2))-methyltransferase RlmL [Pseudomonadales bacterium]|nr:bifunctional 23S rRNA (guanine(2069)-N(7))-methyltransferase RlmK/23S rRNA (guanine(2445)-N(2))-methyltransferase RlmL [Pseudomonadales bacterium]NRA14432.1 bifunctional 23S rRNA (guanine(2069)-N(7))-methyltransferase RlmK/23S rRNA (guanine(2445)-N(2))-methyltransferase RlmL [Oceanospirillaceae bacterium]
MSHRFLATCPKGFEPLLVTELESFGAESVKQVAVGVEFSGELEHAYRACLWSRVGNRVLLPLLSGNAETVEELYDAIQSIDWLEHMEPTNTLAISFTGSSRAINNTHFGALKVKDAIVDQFRVSTGVRPVIEKDTPDIRIHTHLYRGRLAVSLDLSGSSLHRRGYRKFAGTAPLKENLAAALLLRAGWPKMKTEFKQVFDPLCGSGTLLIEAAMMAADIAPGLDREHWGFVQWKKHDQQLWDNLLQEGEKRRTQGLKDNDVQFIGADIDARVLENAALNSKYVGLDALIEYRAGKVEQMLPPNDFPGLLITNPPYGERLGDSSTLMFMYRSIGDQLKKEFRGWKASVFTGNPELCQVIGLKPDKTYKLNNGPLESQLFNYHIYAERTDAEVPSAELEPLSEAGQMFANRLKKNLKSLAKWRKKQQINAYRLYDADIPEYAVAIDIYGDWVHVQEYAAPKSIDQVKVFERLKDVMAAIPQVLQINPKRVVLKQRKRQSGTQQYEKHGHLGKFFEVLEHGCRFRINLKDYLDTGLFLDHRPIRLEIQQQAKGKDFLNLFSYTSSASVHAGIGGAKSTTSVDMSATYLSWSAKNMAMNGFNDSNHHFIQADCLQWLKKQRRPAYDLIFLDPPTFSNSKRMQDVMDLQRDHVRMISSCMRLLRHDGLMIFSNNYRKFKLDYELLTAFEIVEITERTIDADFRRNSRIHKCYEIRHKS